MFGINNNNNTAHQERRGGHISDIDTTITENIIESKGALIDSHHRRSRPARRRSRSSTSLKEPDARMRNERSESSGHSNNNIVNDVGFGSTFNTIGKNPLNGSESRPEHACSDTGGRRIVRLGRLINERDASDRDDGEGEFDYASDNDNKNIIISEDEDSQRTQESLNQHIIQSQQAQVHIRDNINIVTDMDHDGGSEQPVTVTVSHPQAPLHKVGDDADRTIAVDPTPHLIQTGEPVSSPAHILLPPLITPSMSSTATTAITSSPLSPVPPSANTPVPFRDSALSVSPTTNPTSPTSVGDPPQIGIISDIRSMDHDERAVDYGQRRRESENDRGRVKIDNNTTTLTEDSNSRVHQQKRHIRQVGSLSPNSSSVSANINAAEEQLEFRAHQLLSRSQYNASDIAPLDLTNLAALANQRQHYRVHSDTEMMYDRLYDQASHHHVVPQTNSTHSQNRERDQHQQQQQDSNSSRSTARGANTESLPLTEPAYRASNYSITGSSIESSNPPPPTELKHSSDFTSSAASNANVNPPPPSSSSPSSSSSSPSSSPSLSRVSRLHVPIEDGREQYYNMRMVNGGAGAGADVDVKMQVDDEHDNTGDGNQGQRNGLVGSVNLNNNSSSSIDRDTRTRDSRTTRVSPHDHVHVPPTFDLRPQPDILVSRTGLGEETLVKGSGVVNGIVKREYDGHEEGEDEADEGFDHYTLLLAGGPNTGKSSFLRTLLQSSFSLPGWSGSASSSSLDDKMMELEREKIKMEKFFEELEVPTANVRSETFNVGFKPWMLDAQQDRVDECNLIDSESMVVDGDDYNTQSSINKKNKKKKRLQLTLIDTPPIIFSTSSYKTSSNSISSSSSSSHHRHRHANSSSSSHSHRHQRNVLNGNVVVQDKLGGMEGEEEDVGGTDLLSSSHGIDNIIGFLEEKFSAANHSAAVSGEENNFDSKNGKDFVHLCIYLLNPEDILPVQTPINQPQRFRASLHHSGHDDTHTHGHGYSPHHRHVSVTGSPRARLPRSAARTSTSSPRSRSSSPPRSNSSFEERGRKDRRENILDIHPDRPILNSHVNLHPSHPDFHDIPHSGREPPDGSRRDTLKSKNEAHLPLSQIESIRTLSRLVNVLPVLARADTLTASQLQKCKDVVRKDLMNVGIGFGIFDVVDPEHVEDGREGHEPEFEPPHSASASASSTKSATNSATTTSTGVSLTSTAVTTATGATTPFNKLDSRASSPTFKTTLTLPPQANNTFNAESNRIFSSTSSVSTGLQPNQSLSIRKIHIPPLPHAIISPDIFPVLSLSQTQLFNSVDKGICTKMDIDGAGAESAAGGMAAVKLIRKKDRISRCSNKGQFLRSFRWGCLDVLDEKHCDFLPLAKAIFYHMEALKTYTKDYLFENFCAEQEQLIERRHQLSIRAEYDRRRERDFLVERTRQQQQRQAMSNRGNPQILLPPEGHQQPQRHLHHVSRTSLPSPLPLGLPVPPPRGSSASHSSTPTPSPSYSSGLPSALLPTPISSTIATPNIGALPLSSRDVRVVQLPSGESVGSRNTSMNGLGSDLQLPYPTPSRHSHVQQSQTPSQIQLPPISSIALSAPVDVIDNSLTRMASRPGSPGLQYRTSMRRDGREQGNMGMEMYTGANNQGQRHAQQQQQQQQFLQDPAFFRRRANLPSLMVGPNGHRPNPSPVLPNHATTYMNSSGPGARPMSGPTDRIRTRDIDNERNRERVRERGRERERRLPPVTLTIPDARSRPISPVGITANHGGSMILHGPAPIPSLPGVGTPNRGAMEMQPVVQKKEPRSRAKNKKITVACNFCRSRKLKCDGGRPACSQCIKRSHPCDYMPHGKRRGAHPHHPVVHNDNETGSRRPQPEDDAASEADEHDVADSGGEEKYYDANAIAQDEGDHQRSHLQSYSQSPAYVKPFNMNQGHGHIGFGHHTISKADNDSMSNTPSQSRPASRRSTNVDTLIAETLHSPPIVKPHPSDSDNDRIRGRERERERDLYFLTGSRPNLDDNEQTFNHSHVEKPLIAALPFSGGLSPNSSAGMGVTSTVPPSDMMSGMHSAPETHSSERKRVNASGKTPRSSSNYGPKVVACNFCRARKTKCDGLHPSCSSCSRRSLPCNYVNDPSNGTGRRKNAVTAAQPASQTSSKTSPPLSRMHSPGLGSGISSVSTYTKMDRHSPLSEQHSASPYKRTFVEESDNTHPMKKYRPTRPEDLDVRSGDYISSSTSSSAVLQKA